MQNDAPKKATELSLMERSLLALRQQRKRVEELEAERHAQIAVVGMSCRFPGADDLAAYWNLLSEGREAVSEVGPDRWQRRHAGSGAPDAGRYAGLLENPGGFDAEFFNISPREALSMDPQQRWVLEEAWHALEHAGIAPDSLDGSRSGVFVGATARDYAARLQDRQAETPIDAFYVSGNALNFIAGRLAYQLGLRGPSLAVDTACSSALTAVHLAIQSLRRGECGLAIAVGVNVVMAREVSEASARSNLLAADGRCKTFDASADGIVRGEGCGVVVLMPLAAALKQGRPVLAVLRGSAINQDGASSGLMTPNLAAQADVLNAALADARVPATAIDYVEAHGTGTSLGDPIELRALGQVFADRGEPVWVGSVKTNFGHLESAAGMAGLIKVILSMRAGSIPPHLHLTRPTPHADWSRLPLRIPLQRTPWPQRDRRHLAGVSAFGGSGSNAHVIVEQAPANAAVDVQGPWLLPLSAHSLSALEALKARWAQALRREQDPGRQRLLCARARTGRALLRHRFAVTGECASDLIQALAADADADADAGAMNRAPVVAFLFSGQGSQYVGMGRDLYAAEPAFRRALDALAPDYHEDTGAELCEVLWDEHGAWLAQARYAQPAMFALQMALVQTWADFGIRPDVVLGHSIGEIAAACAAQAFDARTGFRLAAARGRLMQEHCVAGEMLAVAADAAQVAHWLAGYPGLAVAARNARRQTVVAGAPDQVREFLDELRQQGVQAQRLQVSHAFHSDLMSPMLPHFDDACRHLPLGMPALDFISSRTGAPEREAIADPSHWVRHVREPVAFVEALESLSMERPTVLVEIGPGRTLLGLSRLAAIDAQPVTSLQSGREGPGFLEAQAQLFRSGARVSWPHVHGDHVDAPVYPFQHQSFMVEGGDNVEARRVDLLDWHWQPCCLPLEGGRQPVLGIAGATDSDAAATGWPRIEDARVDGFENGAFVDSRFLHLDRYSVADAVTELARSYVTWGERSPQRTYWLCLGDDTGGDAQSAMVRSALVGFALSTAWRGGMPIGVLQTARALDPSDPALRRLFSCDAAEVLAEPWRRVKDGLWLAARLIARDDPQPASPPATGGHGGTTVITGGFGDLGLALVERIAGLGDGPIIVLSRRPEASLDDGVRERLATLRGAGARIHSYAVDVSERGALQDVFDSLHADGIRVSDIYHLAGSLTRSVPTEALGPDEVRRQLAAKQVGAQLLHEITRAMPEVRLLLVGSAAGAWGSGDYALYAAANAAVAGLADWRIAHGLPTVHVAAGPIAGTDMAGGADGDRVESAGLFRMAAADVLDAMECLRRDRSPSAIVVQADWPRFSRACSSRTGLRWFEALATGSTAFAMETPTPATGGEGAAAGVREQWGMLSREARRQAVRQLADSVIAKALGIRADVFDADAPLLDAGVDSVIALEIGQRLAQRLGVTLPATLVFEHGNARAIAEHLFNLLYPETPDQAPPAAPPLPGTDEPIAIVGASARMPGGADDIHGFWRNLLEGVDGIVDAPRDRFDVDAWLRQHDDERPYTMAMGALSGIEYFDAALFGIGPREARLMDPQQRLVLQGAWHALEHAGIDPLSLRGRKGGVFLGVADCEYLPILREHVQLAPELAYLGTSTKTNVIAGRVSFFFGWQGPSVTLDTACSSAATAIHLACQSLRSGESEFALAGGVNLILDPQTFASPCKANMLARDGRCKSFDSRADGYVRSEGCGLVVLKRLSHALRDGDNVIATIAGSAMNQDGRGSSLTAPNPAAQQRVIEDALRVAGIAADDVDVIEAHGTGTPLGDPIEWAALSAVFDAPSRQRPLWVGSAKSLIGHAEAAAGAAGLIKLALSLGNGRVTDNRHFDTLNPEIVRQSAAMIRVLHAGDTGRRGTPRIGGISSFGFSGTNVHLVLAAPPSPTAQRDVAPVPVLCISAGTPAALQEACEHWLHVLENDAANRDDYLAFCASSRWGRWAAAHRVAIAADDAVQARSALREALAADRGGTSPRGLGRGVVQLDALSPSDADRVLVEFGQPLVDDADERVFLATVAFARELMRQGIVVEQWRAGDAPVAALAAVEGSIEPVDAWRAMPGPASQSSPHSADPASWSEREDTRVLPLPLRGDAAAVSLTALVPAAPDATSAPFAARLMARAFESGLTVQWPDRGARRSPEAPLTPFARTRFWPHSGKPLVQTRPTRAAGEGHYLLGTRHTLPRSSEIRFRRRFTPTSPGYVDDHRLLNMVVVPAASHISMVIAAWRANGGSWPCTVEDVRLLNPLVLHDDGARTVELILVRRQDAFDVELISCDGDPTDDDAGWTTHMRCRLRAGAGDAVAPTSADAVLRDWTPTISRDEFYAQFWEHGYTLGESFRWLGEGWVKGADTVRRVLRPALPESLEPFGLHPGLIDTCFSVLSSGQLAWTDDKDHERIFIPVSIEKVEFHGWCSDHGSSWMHARACSQPAAEGARAREDICLFESDGHVVARIVGFETRQAQRDALRLGYRESVRDDLYRLDWQPVSAEAPPAPTETRLGLVGTGSVLDEVLSSNAGIGPMSACRVAWPFDIWNRSGQDIEVWASEVVEQVRRERVQTLLILPPTEDLGPDFRGRMLHAMVALWRSLQMIDESSRPAVVLLTHDGVPLPGRVPQPLHGALWGFARGLQAEQGEQAIRVLDLEGAESPEIRMAGVRELLAADAALSQTAWRGGQRWEPRLQRHKLSRSHGDLPVRRDARYVISGGLGGIGQALARWLIERGAPLVQLLVRRPDAAATAGLETHAAGHGTQIEVVVLPAACVDALAEHTLPLGGIFHAAGSTADALVTQTTPDSIDAIIAGKWTLGEALTNLALRARPDFVVMFGSLAATLPGPGQAVYAAANAALEAMSTGLRAQGVHAVTIAFGPWSEVGMASRLGAGYQQRLLAMGLQPFHPQQGLHVLSQVAQEPQDNVIAASVQWSKFLATRVEYSSSNLLVAFRGDAPSGALTAEGQLRIELQVLPPAQREAALELSLKTTIAKVLGLSGPTQVGRQRRLFDLGLDSMAAMDLRELLQSQLAMKLRATVLFDYPSVEALSRSLITELFGTGIDAPSAPRERLQVEIDALSEADAEALLLAELKE